MPAVANKLEKALIERNVKKHPSGCWEWLKFCDGDGYGRVTINSEKFLAHRVAYMVYHGPIPDNLCVLHECDNPSCVNPEHLFLGTPQDNMDDKVAKGRHHVGERSTSSFLTEADVLDIRASDEGPTALSRKYGVAQSTVSRIRSGELWKHI
jgi:hypothetical protein